MGELLNAEVLGIKVGQSQDVHRGCPYTLCYISRPHRHLYPTAAGHHVRLSSPHVTPVHMYHTQPTHLYIKNLICDQPSDPAAAATWSPDEHLCGPSVHSEVTHSGLHFRNKVCSTLSFCFANNIEKGAGGGGDGRHSSF